VDEHQLTCSVNPKNNSTSNPRGRGKPAVVVTVVNDFECEFECGFDGNEATVDAHQQTCSANPKNQGPKKSVCTRKTGGEFCSKAAGHTGWCNSDYKEKNGKGRSRSKPKESKAKQAARMAVLEQHHALFVQPISHGDFECEFECGFDGDEGEVQVHERTCIANPNKPIVRGPPKSDSVWEVVCDVIADWSTLAEALKPKSNHDTKSNQGQLHHLILNDFLPVFEEQFAAKERQRLKAEKWAAVPKRISSRVSAMTDMKEELEKNEAIRLAEVEKQAEEVRAKRQKREDENKLLARTERAAAREQKLSSDRQSRADRREHVDPSIDLTWYASAAKIHRSLSENSAGGIFLYPVDEKQVPGYYDVIKYPTDLQTIGRNLSEKLYKRKEDWAVEVYLMCDNCRLFNTMAHVKDYANQIDDLFTKKMTRAFKGYTKHPIRSAMAETENPFEARIDEDVGMVVRPGGQEIPKVPRRVLKRGNSGDFTHRAPAPTSSVPTTTAPTPTPTSAPAPTPTSAPGLTAQVASLPTSQKSPAVAAPMDVELADEITIGSPSTQPPSAIVRPALRVKAKMVIPTRPPRKTPPRSVSSQPAGPIVVVVKSPPAAAQPAPVAAAALAPQRHQQPGAVPVDAHMLQAMAHAQFQQVMSQQVAQQAAHNLQARMQAAAMDLLQAQAQQAVAQAQAYAQVQAQQALVQARAEAETAAAAQQARAAEVQADAGAHAATAVAAEAAAQLVAAQNAAAAAAEADAAAAEQMEAVAAEEAAARRSAQAVALATASAQQPTDAAAGSGLDAAAPVQKRPHKEDEVALATPSTAPACAAAPEAKRARTEAEMEADDAAAEQAEVQAAEVAHATNVADTAAQAANAAAAAAGVHAANPAPTPAPTE
jgi:hypothetical protein